MSVTEEVKSRLDIVNFIGQYVQVKKAGRNYTARCPFHNERTPSFIIFPDSQSWRCFGACGEGGDIFNFVMKREGLDFPSALRLLAEKAGVELHDKSPERADAEQHLDKLRGLLDESARFYHDKLLNFGPASVARGYVRKRGLSAETVEKFQLGYAPNEWTMLLNHLLHLGYSEDDAVEAGVAIRNDNGRVYDRFRHRLMIPIHNVTGKAIGFGARALDPDDNPKYLNSPQGPLFDKSATLFGLDHARRAIREQETAVIVEGYMDAIQAHQGGFTNVVAQMGTALTEPQLKTLSKFARRLILALDPDAAGAKATMRGLDVIRQVSKTGEVFLDTNGLLRQASRLDVDLQVMTLPDGQDPDDVIRETPDKWREFVDNARPVAEYVISVGTAEITQQSTAAEREKVARDLLPILAATENKLREQANFQLLSHKLHIDVRKLVEWAAEHGQKFAPREILPHVVSPEAGLNASDFRQKEQKSTTTTENADSPALQPEAKPISKGLAAERYCLAVLLRSPGLMAGINRRFREIANKAKNGDEVMGSFSVQDFTNTDYRAIYSTLQSATSQYEIEPEDFLRQHLPYDLWEQIEELTAYSLEYYGRSLQQYVSIDILQVKRDQQKFALMGGLEQELRVLEAGALELRKARLRRENLELQFLQKEQEAEPAAELRFLHRVSLNSTAIRHIEAAISQLSQAMR